MSIPLTRPGNHSYKAYITVMPIKITIRKWIEHDPQISHACFTHPPLVTYQILNHDQGEFFKATDKLYLQTSKSASGPQPL